MTVSYTWKLEFYLSGAWRDISADVRAQDIVINRGIKGANITDRVAGVGMLSFMLNNSISNSGGLLGYYSPDNTNCRTGFGLGTKVRFSITYSGTIYYKFYGKISDINPVAGQYSARYVEVRAVDYMNELLVHYMNAIAVQVNKRGDQLLTTIVANLPTAPLATSYATGPDIFPYALHDVQDEWSSGINAIQRVDQSGLSYTFVKGDITGGETLTWQTRYTRLLLASLVTFNNTMTGLTVNRGAESIYNTIRATGYPVALGIANEVLWTSQQEITLNAEATVTLIVRYTDPSGAGTRVALSPGTEVAPEIDVDYKMSSVSGSGNDLNANLYIDVTWGGNTASIVLKNEAAVIGYINLLRLRGKIVRLYDPIEIVSIDGTSKSNYGDRVLTFSMPYQGNVNFISGISSELLTRLKDPFSTIDNIEFIANSSATLMAAAMTCDVGCKTTLTETVTGFSSDDFYVNSYELAIGYAKITCRLGNLETAGITDNIGIWGTVAGDSGVWGTVAGDSSRWIF